MALRVVASEGECGTEMAVRGLVPLGTKLELSKRGPIKRVRVQTISVGDSLDFLDSTFRAIALCDGDSPVESDYRRGANPHQGVIKGYYLYAVRILHAAGGRVDRCDCGLNVILAHFRTLGGMIEER